MADLGDLLGGGANLDFLSGDNGNLGVGLNSDDANTLALLGAMGGVEKAGLQRTATPMGSIAQALIPLFAAPIQARQLEAQSALQGLLLKVKLAGALATLQKAGGGDEPSDLDKAKTEEIRARTQAQQEYQKDPAAYIQKIFAAAQAQAAAAQGGTPGATPDQAGGMAFRPEISIPSKPGELPGIKFLPPPTDSPATLRRLDLQEQRAATQDKYQRATLDLLTQKADEARKKDDRRTQFDALKERGSIINGQLRELDQQIENFKKDAVSRNWFSHARPQTPDKMAAQREILVGQLRDVQQKILALAGSGPMDFDPTK